MKRSRFRYHITAHVYDKRGCEIYNINRNYVTKNRISDSSIFCDKIKEEFGNETKVLITNIFRIV